MIRIRGTTSCWFGGGGWGERFQSQTKCFVYSGGKTNSISVLHCASPLQLVIVWQNQREWPRSITSALDAQNKRIKLFLYYNIDVNQSQMKKMVSPQNQFLTTSQMRKQTSFTSQHLGIYYHTVFLKKNTCQLYEKSMSALPQMHPSPATEHLPNRQVAESIYGRDIPRHLPC